MSVKENLDLLLEELKSDECVLSISLIGSAAQKMTALDQVNDIDLFVVKTGCEGFEREVRVIDGMDFDISYVDVDDMNKIITKNNHFWINVLARAKHVFKRNSLIEGYFLLANKLFVDGPIPLKEQEVQHIRFKLTGKVEDLKKRMSKPTDFQYLLGVYLQDALTSYFRLQNTWVPRDKKIMDLIFDTDLILYELVKASYKATSTQEHLELFDDIVLYILKPYGGKLFSFERARLPIYE